MKTADIDVTYVGHYGTDLTTVNAARVSFNKESEWDMVEREVTPKDVASNPFPEFPIERIETPKLKQSDAKLIAYLAKHKHFSPFNHSFISVRVKAPIFCARQMVKHKFMPWNEVSRRYVDDEPEFYMPDLRKRSENVKQGSLDEILFPDYDPVDSVKKSLEMYNWLLSDGVAPEVARAFLPQNMMTTWVWSATLGAFCDMLRLRLDPHSQYESRIVANKILEIVSPLFPVSVAALLEIR